MNSYKDNVRRGGKLITVGETGLNPPVQGHKDWIRDCPGPEEFTGIQIPVLTILRKTEMQAQIAELVIPIEVAAAEDIVADKPLSFWQKITGRITK